MKKHTIILFFALIMCTLFHANAQAPYKNGIGVTVGNMQALSFKTFGGNHFAFQVDLGTKYITTDGRFKGFELSGVDFWTLELNPNFMFEGRLAGNLYGLIGVGASIGYSWSTINWQGFIWSHSRNDFGKCGANGIFGLEYKFNAPVALQLDFRPGYGCLFAENFDAHYFDWSANLGIHYTF
ncbi:MAG: hypothetical protein J5741_06510 [Bacteroidales bacterium]|nr:hypothetical protein [Bacteroidales bacterium]